MSRSYQPISPRTARQTTTATFATPSPRYCGGDYRCSVLGSLDCTTCTLPRDKEEAYQSSITDYQSPENDNCPPPLLPKRCIPLPAITSNSILLNPILAHSLNQPPISFDLSQPLSTAILSPSFSFNTVTCTANWRQQPAMCPPTIGSMTLRFGQDNSNCPIWRPITVFPVSPFDSVVTIDDVLKAVSRAVCMAVKEGRSHRLAPKRGHVRRCAGVEAGPPMSVYDAFLSDCVVWWGGLYLSPTERDVWMLDTRHQISTHHLHQY